MFKFLVTFTDSSVSLISAESIYQVAEHCRLLGYVVSTIKVIS